LKQNSFEEFILYVINFPIVFHVLTVFVIRFLVESISENCKWSIIFKNIYTGLCFYGVLGIRKLVV